MVPVSLSDILAPMSEEAFFADLFGKETKSFAMTVPKTHATYSLSDFERLLWRQEQDLPTYLTIVTSDGEMSVPRRRHAKDLFRWSIDQFIEGAALRFNRLERVEPFAARLARDIAHRAIARVTIAALLVPQGDSLPLAPCDERTDYIVIQADGSGAVNLGAFRGENGHSTGWPLATGDSLYVPAGQNLYFCATSPSSICLLVSIEAFTTQDWVESLVEVSTECEPDLRRTVPCSEPAARSRFLSSIDRVASLGSLPEIRKKAWENLRLRLSDQHRPEAHGHFGAAKLAGDIDATSVVRLRSGSIYAVSVEPESCVVFIPGLGEISARDSHPGGLLFHSEALSMLDEISVQEGSFAARDLSPSYSEAARVATVRRLLWYGALELDTLTETPRETVR